MTKFFQKLKNELIDCFCFNRFFLLFLLICFVFGIIIAIINLINLKEIIVLNNLSDCFLLDYLKNDIGLFAFFLKRFFLNLFIYLIIIVVCFNKYTSYILCFLMLYFGYIIVFNMGVFILCFGFFGLIFALINIFLIGICYIFLMIFLSFFCKKSCGRNYFASVFSNYEGLCVLLLALLVLCLIEMILLPLLSSTFVVII